MGLLLIGAEVIENTKCINQAKHPFEHNFDEGIALTVNAIQLINLLTVKCLKIHI